MKAAGRHSTLDTQHSTLNDPTVQVRNLKLLLGAAVALVVAVVIAGALVYEGDELPPDELRAQHTSADGYAAPASTPVVPAGAVARGAPLEDEAAPPPPPTVAAMRSPVAADAEAIEAGKRLYDINCAMCHGEPKHGVGPVGQAYVPVPRDLARLTPPSEGRVFAAITWGVRSTPTPETERYLPVEWHSFRALLPTRARWQVAAYVRTAER